MGFPPPETKIESTNILGGVDPLGVEVSAQQLEQIRELEASDHHATFIVLSDVHLDDPQVMEHLDLLFQGLESVQPSMFILMGDFLSTPVGAGAGSNSLHDLTDYLDELGNLILKYPKLADFSKFVLVPGPNDPGSSKAFPRHPVRSPFAPAFVYDPHLLTASSLPAPCSLHARTDAPCAQPHMHHEPLSVRTHSAPPKQSRFYRELTVRLSFSIRYYTQDIVVFRDNLHHKMHRHAILPALPEDVEEDDDASMEDTDSVAPPSTRPHVDISKHLVKTIIDQAHLCPLPLLVAPINWAFDSALQLFPLPDVLILGDSTEQYQLGYSSVAVFHPGPFHVDFSFVLYRPSTNTTEFSRVEV
jgi:DNA polymerase epsilon subunit 2